MLSNREKHIAIVCNPTSLNGKALKITSDVEILLTGMDIRHKVFVEVWPEAFTAFTEVWIIGGDGTINWFVNHFSSIQLPLALFAGGSGNDLHWMLYGGLSTEQQVESVLQAAPQPIDAGLCNERLFLNGVGIGFDGAIVHDLLGKKKLAGKWSYLLSILKQIAGYREKSCILELPDETIRQDCFMISIANGRRYGGGFRVAPHAILNDALLDISIVGKVNLVQRLRYLPVIEKGRHVNLDFVKYRQISRIRVQCPTRLHAHADGEYFQADAFDIEILPNRFSFLC